MHISEAGDAETALHQTKAQRFDLVFIDIRLPGENGLTLTKSIKADHVNAVVCVITSYDILEYREAAFRFGADHFLVKGESSESEIVGTVEALLHARFVCLVALGDPGFRRQLGMLLQIHWPSMIVAEGTAMTLGASHLETLHPKLILLGLETGGEDARGLITAIRDRSPNATLIGMADEAIPVSQSLIDRYGVDYCVSMTPFGHTDLVGIVNTLHPELARH